MQQDDSLIQQTISHIRHLSVSIGGRGSCTSAEYQAAEYVIEQMKSSGIQKVFTESYLGSPSTYKPYALAFGVALLGTLIPWIFASQSTMMVAALFNAFGAQGMLAETDFSSNWMRWLLPKCGSQNSIGVIPPSDNIRNRVVLCAHLDTHRTPIFYSSRTWHALFGLLVSGAFISMIVGTIIYGLGALFDWSWARWAGLAAAAIQVFALSLCLHADFTPFSPGANDNASGVGAALAIGKCLTANPLKHTETWLVFTGCEETASYGMAAFLDAHAETLGKETVYIILDEVGLGGLNYLTSDGLIIKRKTHPQCLYLARQAAQALQEMEIVEKTGIAYTDAVVATKRGLIALTINSYLEPDREGEMHWHQMSDTVDYIDRHALRNTSAFTRQILEIIDRS